MSAPVDVLAVMDADAAHADAYRIVYGVIDSTPQLMADSSREARAAVAELIEAARQASATLGHAYHTVLDGQLAEYAHGDYQRLDAALARVQGGAA